MPPKHWTEYKSYQPSEISFKWTWWTNPKTKWNKVYFYISRDWFDVALASKGNEDKHAIAQIEHIKEKDLWEKHTCVY